MSSAAVALVTTHPDLWADELERVRAAAPALGRAARDAVRSVLTALLREPGLDPADSREIAALLDALADA